MKNERRDFLRQGLYIVGTFVGGSLLLSCKSSKSKKCDDLSGINKTQLQIRKGLNYVDSSNVAGKNCENCKLYKQPQAGKSCGGCILFAGPVAPAGYCTGWQKKG